MRIENYRLNLTAFNYSIRSEIYSILEPLSNYWTFPVLMPWYLTVLTLKAPRQRFESRKCIRWGGVSANGIHIYDPGIATVEFTEQLRTKPGWTRIFVVMLSRNLPIGNETEIIIRNKFQRVDEKNCTSWVELCLPLIIYSLEHQSEIMLGS